METKTHLLSEKERWNSRVSEKPKGERLSAREECKAKVVTEIRESSRPPAKQSKKRMGDSGFWCESFEREILKCSGAEKRQQGAHTTESEGVLKEINEGKTGRAEEYQLKGSVWHGNISRVNYGVHQCACKADFLRRAWQDGREETGSGANEEELMRRRGPTRRWEVEGTRRRASRERWEGTRCNGDERSEGSDIWCGGNIAGEAGNARAQTAGTEPDKESRWKSVSGSGTKDTVRRDAAVSECEYDNEHSTHPSSTIKGVVTAVTTAKTLNGDSREDSQQRKRRAAEAYRRLARVMLTALALGGVKSQRRGREGMEKKHPGRETEQSIPQLSASCLRARRLAPAHPIPAFLLRETAGGVVKDGRDTCSTCVACRSSASSAGEVGKREVTRCPRGCATAS
ncbi:hypothetical protein K438DRAFT_1764819 [Mycena galopus ATCC 62051]|nr:hypothetical protein K438DRAFT_1764819 [Mycena galopus ATCC 62051]